MLHLKDAITEAFKSSELNQDQFAKSLGVSREVWNRYMNDKGDFPKKAAGPLNELYGIPYEMIFGVTKISQFGSGKPIKPRDRLKSEKVDNELYKSIADLTEVTKLQAEIANKNAEARIREAENNSRLIAMLEKKHGVTGNAEKQTETAFYAKIEALLESLADVAAGKKFHSPEEAAAVFRRRVYARPVEG